MSAQRDLFIIIGLILLLGVVWFVGGGAQRGVPDFFINPLPPLGPGTTYSSFTTRGGGIIPNVSVDLGDRNAQTQQEIQEAITRAGFSGEASPYAGSVSFRSLGATDETDVSEEYIRISVSRNIAQPIPITGWTLLSAKTNRRAVIGEGTELPRSGTVNTEESLTLAASDTAYITTGRSPIGVSFRTNMCTGYFEQFQDFAPSLRNQCPDPEDELNTYPNEPDLDQECIDYIDGLRSCRMQVTTPTFLSNACRAFLTERVNYNGCVQEHRNDSDFYKNEWRIYLGRTEELWEASRDTIMLLDANGRVVDIATN